MVRILFKSKSNVIYVEVKKSYFSAAFMFRSAWRDLEVFATGNQIALTSRETWLCKILSSVSMKVQATGKALAFQHYTKATQRAFTATT